jgi:hypothetical protein
MKRSQEQLWDELQERWTAGEPLSEDEEAQRLALAAQDPLARRELDLIEELRGRLETEEPDDSDRALSERGPMACRRVGNKAILRLVGDRSASDHPPPRNRWVRWPVAAAVALAAAAGAIALAHWLRPTRAVAVADVSEPRSQKPAVEPSARCEVVLATGQVFIVRANGENKPTFGLDDGPLAAGDRIRTQNGHACLTIDPGIDVCLDTSSEIQVASLVANAVSIQVHRGLAVASLTHRAPTESFSMFAQGVTAVAHGTVYALEHRVEGNADGSAVIVLEGRVEVRDETAPAVELVPAHVQWRRHRSEPRVLEATGRSQEGHLGGLIEPRALWQTNALGSVEVLGDAHTQQSTKVTIDDQGPFWLPLQSFAPAGSHRIVLWQDDRRQADMEFRLIAGEHQRVKVPDAGARRASASAAVDPEVFLADARRALEHGRAEAALAAYKGLRRALPASAEASTVLVTMGNLELDKLGSPAAALADFEAYLRRDGGALRPEAMAGKIHSLRALDRSDEERVAIREYLSLFPEGFEAPAFRQRLSSLERSSLER